MYNDPDPVITEFTAERSVACQNEGCQRFEQTIEVELDIENSGGYLELFTYVCTECDHRNDIEVEIGNPESYYFVDNYDKADYA